MSPKGTIKILGVLEASLNEDTWTCSNKLVEIGLNAFLGKRMNISPSMGYPPAHRILCASKWLMAKVVELPKDENVYPPDAVF